VKLDSLVHGPILFRNLSARRDMKLLRNLLVVIAATGMMSSVQAQTDVPDLGILSPSVQTQTGFVTSGSFSDIFNFSIGAEHQGFLGSAIGLAPDGTPTIGAISNLTLELFTGSNATGPIQGSVASTNGSLINLSGTLAEGAYSLRLSGLANGALGGGYQLSVSAAPEPAAWMLLLAGLGLVAFVARRKASLMAGPASMAS
jgi:MYXO-CTERM domain-containing protein